MYRLLTEEQAKEMMEDAKQRLQREQEERKQKGMHEYQHLVGLAEQRMSHCAVFAKKEAK